MELKTVDEMKLEILVEQETSLLNATKLAREYFPFQATGIKRGLEVVIAIYEEFHGKEFPDKQRYGL